MIFKGDRVGATCRVLRVRYELPAKSDKFDPPVVAAVVTLVATNVASGKPKGGGAEHEVSVRPSSVCADFLVPRRKVLQV